jgi:esterase/lipase superfamily enzyme
MFHLASRELKNGFVQEKRIWLPIAKASVKARFVIRDLREIEGAIEGQPFLLDEFYPSLKPRLEEASSIWPDVKRYLRFAPRDTNDPRQNEPVTVRSLRLAGDRIKREQLKLDHWSRLSEPPKVDTLQALRPPEIPIVAAAHGPKRSAAAEPQLFETMEVLIPRGSVRPADVTGSEGQLQMMERRDYLKSRRYPVWFGTNRELITPDGLGEAVPTLRFGRCVVHVPRSHSFGSTGSSWVRRVIRIFRGLEDDRLRIENAQILDRDSFKAQISSELRSWNKRVAFVVVHGFNVTFDEAAIRTAQLGFDLRIDGICAFFSWPSAGKLRRYLSDGDEVQVAKRYFVEFLRELSSIHAIDEIHILAHSMGNRLLLGAIEHLTLKGFAEGARVGQIVLAAADVSHRLFAEHAADYSRLAGRRVTSYSCTKDFPLRISRMLHDHHRVGLEPPIFTAPQLDSISAADLDLHGLGHGYYADVEALLYDLHELIQHDKPPKDRLRIEPDIAGKHWVFRK